MNNIYVIYNLAQHSIYKEFFNNSWFKLSLDWLTNDRIVDLPQAIEAALVEDLLVSKHIRRTSSS